MAPAVSSSAVHGAPAALLALQSSFSKQHVSDSCFVICLLIFFLKLVAHKLLHHNTFHSCTPAVTAAQLSMRFWKYTAASTKVRLAVQLHNGLQVHACRQCCTPAVEPMQQLSQLWNCDCSPVSTLLSNLNCVDAFAQFQSTAAAISCTL